MAEDVTTIDDYISTFPQDVQKILQEVRKTISNAVPGATEEISYKIPTFMLDGKFVIYFAGWKQHISVYPIPAGDAAFQADIESYVEGKGTLKFLLNNPIPYELIERAAEFAYKQRSKG